MSSNSNSDGQPQNEYAILKKLKGNTNVLQVYEFFQNDGRVMFNEEMKAE